MLALQLLLYRRMAILDSHRCRVDRRENPGHQEMQGNENQNCTNCFVEDLYSYERSMRRQAAVVDRFTPRWGKSFCYVPIDGTGYIA
jgi:hypothetical protein